MNKDFAIVSALFNIEREGMDGRAWQDYLDWFGKTLQLKVPMILFVTEDLIAYGTGTSCRQVPGNASFRLPVQAVIQQSVQVQ